MNNGSSSFQAKSYVVVLLAVMACQSLHGYIGTMYHLYNPKIKQHVFLFGDCHKGKSCERQQQEIVEAARKFNAHVIVEDNFVPFPVKSIADSFFAPIKGTPFMEPYYDLLGDPLAFDVNKKYFGNLTYCPPSFNPSSPLTLMSAACSFKQVSYHNVEWRTLLAASVNGAPIPASACYASVQRVLEELRHYQDGPVPDAYCQAVIASCQKAFQSQEFKDLCVSESNLEQAIEKNASRYIKQLAEFDAQREWEDLVARYIQHTTLHTAKVPNEKRCNPTMLCKEAFLKEAIEQSKTQKTSMLAQRFLLLSWASIIDVRIIHEIFQKQQHPVVFVCAGLQHVSCTACQLLTSGYTLIHSDTAGKSALEAWENNFIDYRCLSINDYFKEYYCEKSPTSLAVSTQSAQSDEQATASETPLSKILQLVPGETQGNEISTWLPSLNSYMSCELEAEVQADKNITAACRHIPLMLAIKAEARETLLQEIAQAKKTDCQDCNGNTILACAIKLHAWGMVRELLQVLPDSHIAIANDHGFTPLTHAANAGCDESVIHELVRKGADVNQNINQGRTALTYMLQSKHYNEATLRALLAHGALPDFPYHSFENPLCLAATHGHAGAIDLLCTYGADINHKICLGQPLLHLYIQQLHLPTEQDICMIKTMLEHGADLQQQNSFGQTPLDLALLNHKWHAPEQSASEYPLTKTLQAWLREHPHH